MAMPDGGVQPFAYNWGQGNISPEIFVNNPGEYCVTLTDGIGCESIACIDVGQPFFLPCSAKFSYETIVDVDTQVTVIPNILNLGIVEIEYKDVDGEIFRSAIFDQSSEASFQIISKEEYQNNEFGQPTVLYSGAFNCVLRSDGGAQLILENAEVTFAVAY